MTFVAHKNEAEQMAYIELGFKSSNKSVETLKIQNSVFPKVISSSSIPSKQILHPLRIIQPDFSRKTDDIPKHILIREINNKYLKNVDLHWYNKEEVVEIINNPLISTGRSLYRFLRKHNIFYFGEIADSNGGIHKLTIPKIEFIDSEFFGVTNRTLTRRQFKLEHQKILFSEKGIALIRKILF